MTSPLLLLSTPSAAPGTPAVLSVRPVSSPVDGQVSVQRGAEGASASPLQGWSESLPIEGGPERLSVPVTAELLRELQAPQGASEEAQDRLVEILEAFDPTGALAAELDSIVASLQAVAVASAESPHLDPAAALLGSGPRVALGDAVLGGLAGEGTDSGGPTTLDPIGALPVSLALPESVWSDGGLSVGAAEAAPVESVARGEGVQASLGLLRPVEGFPAPLIDAVQRGPAPPPPTAAAAPIAADVVVAPPAVVVPASASIVVPPAVFAPTPDARAPAAASSARGGLLSAASVTATSGPSVPTGPHAASVELPRGVTAQVLAAGGRAAASPGTAAAGSGTFDAAPWLLPQDAAAGPPLSADDSPGPRRTPVGGSPSARPAGLTLARAGSLAPASASVGAEAQVATGGADAVGTTPQDAARSPGAAVHSARVGQALASAMQTTAPELPIMPGDKSLTRLEVRVADGERMLRVGVVHESEGYAVEVRAHRDVVAEIQDMEGDVDAALREDGGDGLASFDASAEDAPADPDADLMGEADSTEAGAPPRATDPHRLLDRHA